MASSIANMSKIPELRKRIFFTLAMLAIYRLGIYIPTPGVNTATVAKLFDSDTVFSLFNMLSGGALEQSSVLALGIMPYISASIILQLLTVAIPFLERLSKEGEAGRKKITQYTRYLTVIISVVQGLTISYGLERSGQLVAGAGGLSFYILTTFTLTTGTCFLMWLGEQITERGIGNGISLIIFAGIVATVPSAIGEAFTLRDSIGGAFGLTLVFAYIALIAFCIILVERAQRRIPIQYAKRMVGRKMMASNQTSHLPLKLNTAGVIPAIFASSLLFFPATISQFVENPILQNITAQLSPPGPLYLLFFGGLIIFFSFFYTAIQFNPKNVSDNIQKYGGFIPGIRPGKATESYIDRVLTRITLVGALYITAICLIPTVLNDQLNLPRGIAFTFGGTSILIMIGVAMDTVAQVESHLMNRNYDGFLGAKSGKFKGRRG